ncbi:unnamed protein product [Brachionus calyciflorus]|uniref:SCP domain-containing protein n=1 Tax=Brachionus calyciflorus TaxID=104777 RepID=A0A813MRZ4_9BILA|nr:unnamed protein product [Brachionus calyciflorus]
MLFFCLSLTILKISFAQTNPPCIQCFCLYPQTPTSNTTTPTPLSTTTAPTTSTTIIPTTSTTSPTTITTTTQSTTTTTSPLIYNELNCVFPFQMYGVLYDKCVSFDGRTYWCSLDRIYTNRAAQCKEACPQLARNLLADTNNIHSSCLESSSSATGLFPTLNQTQQILELHNRARSVVQPTAVDMKRVSWDLGLARLAQRWSETCNFDHDCTLCRRLLNNQTISVGQNAFAIFGSEYNPNTLWPEVINFWIDEKKNFVYGLGSRTGNFQDVGHYTQIIDSNTARIGCGAAKCDNNIYAYCNYALAQDDWKIPYKRGIACSQCSRKNCQNNLCNCSKLCQNNGILDPIKCECKCPDRFSGELCEIG